MADDLSQIPDAVANDMDVVIEPQIISPQATTASPTAFDINAYNAVIEVIRRRLSIIAQTQEELKKLKEMHDTVLLNEPTYVAVEETVKDAQAKKKGIIDQINKLPNVASIHGKMRDIKDQLKGHAESLVTELMEYYRTAGVTEIEDEQGNVQEFKISIKLKPKRRTE